MAVRIGRPGESSVISRRGGGVTTCCANLGLDAVESRIVHIIRKGNDTDARGTLADTVDEAFLNEDEGRIRGNLVDGRVGNLDPIPGQSVLHGGGDHH